MRIRNKLSTPSALAPPLESLHRHEPPSDPPNPPFRRLDLQLTLVRGTSGWICKTDDDCMHYNSSNNVGDDMIGISSTAPTVDVGHAGDNSSNAKPTVGISCFASYAQLDEKSCTVETESAMKTNTRMESSGEKTKKRQKKSDMESVREVGSRCNRVNGRGWRCWKQTVHGHSLCAHHSMQGRLRRSTGSSKDEKQEHTALSSSPVLLDEEPLMMLRKRKKKKIGMIKNRSISGLLAQTETQPAPPMPVLDSIAIL